jgi:hypothetical protein
VPNADDENIKVFVRVRPLNGGTGTKEENTRCAKVTSDTTITLNNKVRIPFVYASPTSFDPHACPLDRHQRLGPRFLISIQNIFDLGRCSREATR